MNNRFGINKFKYGYISVKYRVMILLYIYLHVYLYITLFFWSLLPVFSLSIQRSPTAISSFVYRKITRQNPDLVHREGDRKKSKGRDGQSPAPSPRRSARERRSRWTVRYTIPLRTCAALLLSFCILLDQPASEVWSSQPNLCVLEKKVSLVR